MINSQKTHVKKYHARNKPQRGTMGAFKTIMSMHIGIYTGFVLNFLIFHREDSLVKIITLYIFKVHSNYLGRCISTKGLLAVTTTKLIR